MTEKLSWDKIKTKYPNVFILIKNFKEESVCKNTFKITEGEVISYSNDFKIILNEYRKHKNNGIDVLYCFPNTQDFIIEDSPAMNFFK
jgi:hypothetical protein